MLAACLMTALIMPVRAAEQKQTACDCGNVVQVFLRGFGRMNAKPDFSADHTEFPEYEFHYDFRSGPYKPARQLNDFIEELCRITNHEKISLMGSSQGSNIVMTYVKEYGIDRLETLTLVNGASMGATLMGEIFTNRFALSGPATINYFSARKDNHSDSPRRAAFWAWLRTTPLQNFYMPLNIGSETGGWFYRQWMSLVVGWMPILLTFLPEDDYREARRVLEGHAQYAKKYAGLLAECDKYFDEVQTKTTQLLLDAKEAGVRVAVIASYGKAPIPLIRNTSYQCDSIIDTSYESLGATTAPIGETLPPGGDGRYRSPDGVIDASTCALPDQTWFIKGSSHTYKTSHDLRQWIIHCKAYPSIHENPLYPQYLYLTKDGKTIPLPGENANLF